MLYFFVFVLSICGLVYELMLGSISSYLVGNSVLQFSLTIGLFLFGLGIGSYFSRIFRNFIKTFFFSELVLGVVGGFSVFMIKFLYIYFINFDVIFYLFYIFIVIFIGTIVGLEVPLIANILNKQTTEEYKNTGNEFQNIISDVFTYDYLGALFATFLFPFVLLPWLGIDNAALFMGFLNILVTIMFLFNGYVRRYLEQEKIFGYYLIISLVVIFSYIFLFVIINKPFDAMWNDFFYKDPVVYQKKSKLQDIVLTKDGEDIRMYLDGNLQFVSLDEKRYHHGLWHIPKNHIEKEDKKNRNILILGGGDGLLARNVIDTFDNKFNFKITLVELDPAVTDLAQENKLMKKLNKNSLNHKNVDILNKDAFKYVMNHKEKKDIKYDIIVADFPDPRNNDLAKLYSSEFYGMIESIITKEGVFVTQAGNAFFTKESYWCIYKTLKDVFDNGSFSTYNVYVPSFGNWGFIAASQSSLYTGDDNMIDYSFDSDYKVDLNNLQINKLDRLKIIDYYLEGWERYNL